MRIKIKRKFKAVLSLLVTVMLLVGIMPSSVWDGIKVDAANTTVTIYVDTKDGDQGKYWHRCRLNVWLHYHTSGWFRGTEEATKGSLSDSEWHELLPKGVSNTISNETGYYVAVKDSQISSVDVNGKTLLQLVITTSNNTDYLEEIQFRRKNDTRETADYTDNISASSLANDQVYVIEYTTRSNGHTNHTVEGLSTYTSNCAPLATTSFSNKDLNVPSVDETPNYTETSDKTFVDATLYDYFSDYELSENKKRTTISNSYSWGDARKHLPIMTFNKALSNYYSTHSVQHPLYFGDIQISDGFNFQTVNTMLGGDGLYVYNSSYPQLFHDNNSVKRVGDTNYTHSYNYSGTVPQTGNNFGNNHAGTVATQGLYSNFLGGATVADKQPDGDLYLSGGVEAPFFNKDWLENKSNANGIGMVGAGYEVKFPFFKVPSGTSITDVLTNATSTAACDYWEIDSSKQSQTLRLSKSSITQEYYLKQKTTSGVHGRGNNGIKTTTYDFFPFSDPLTTTDADLYFDQLNYNFGLSMTIPFALNSQGTVGGGDVTNDNDTPITFEFNGDDDLVVYVDGVLVLDIGGAHEKVAGKIDFSADGNYVQVSQIKTNNGESSAVADTKKTLTSIQSGILSNIRDGKKHYLKVFYMERGLFESNLLIRHNLPLVGKRSFKVDTVVNTSNVDSIFTTGNDAGPTNFRNNINMIDFDIDVRFSKPNLPSQYDFLDFGDTPEVYNNNQNFDKEPSTKTYSFTQQNGQNSMLYINDFMKKDAHYLEVLEKSNYDLKFKGTNGSTKATKNKKIGDLFTCSWDLRLQSAASSSGTSGNSTVTDNNNVPDTFGPVHTTASSSRPARATKTTSTSAATITDRYFDFNGTVDDPDQIVFTNTLQTKTLTITKNFNDSSGLADNTNYNFSVTVTFDNVGGSDIQLEEARNATDGALITGGTNVTITKQHTFTLTKTDSSASIEIAVPVNTDVTIVETGIASGKEPTYSRNNTPEASPSATFTFNMGTENQDVVISNPGPTKPIILKVQKVWENVQEIPANTSVSFKVERKIGTGSWTAVGGNAKTADSVPYTVTYDSANGKVTFTNSSAITSSNDGKVIWTAYIYDPNNLNENTYQYQVTEYKNATEMYDNNNTFVVNSITLKVKYDVEGLLNNGSYHNETENAPANPNGDTTNYSTDENIERILTLSVINRAFIKIRVQSYFTQTDANLVAATPSESPYVNMKVQRLNGSTWEDVVNSASANTSAVSITTTALTDTETNPNRKYFEYVLAGEYDPDYQYRVLEYTQGNSTTPVETPNNNTSFNSAFTTISYSFDGGNKINNREGTDLDKAENPNTHVEELVVMTDANSNSGYGITLAVLNSGDGSSNTPETGGHGGYIPIAGGFIAILLAGAGYFIYKKRIFA